MNMSLPKDKATFLRNLLILLTGLIIIFSIFSNSSIYIYILSNILFLSINSLVLIILFYVAKESSSKRAFISWILIALSHLVTMIGNITWIILQTGFNQLPSPSIADAFYLAYYPLIILGILYLPVTKTLETKKYQILIDTGIMIIAAALIFWVFIINPILIFQPENTFNMGLYLFYIILDAFLLFTLFYLSFNWFGQVKKAPLLLLILSVIILSSTNVIFIYNFLYGTYTPGGLIDAGWLGSYILTALAGISYIKDEKISFPSYPYKLSTNSKWISYLSFVWLFFIYLLLFWTYNSLEGDEYNIVVIGSGIMITMVFIRQIIALEESERTGRLLQDNKEKLEKREQHLSLITDNMKDLITQSNSKGIYQYISPSALKLIGYKHENMLGENVFDFIHPDDLEIFKSSFQNALKSKSSNEIEYRFKNAAGDYIWFETIGTPIFNNEDKFMGFICGTRDINDRKHAEDQIKASLEEKNVLLKEIHHRVKNNMQIISSLLNLQSRYIKDEKNRDILIESQDRVRSMAMIHENLYRSENLARINLKEYIQKLVSGLFNSYGINPGLIKSKISIKNVLLDIDSAIPCGLILNELVTNSLKHAFPANYVRGPANGTFASLEDNGEIHIKILKEGNILKMIVGDNGIGFPENIDFKNTESLGLQLVNTLVEQLNGSIELENIDGTKFTIKFEKNKEK